MATRPDFEDSDISTFPRPSPADQRLVAVWKEVSIIVHSLRLSDVPTASNGMLREYIRREKSHVLSPRFQLWIGDNFQFAGRLSEAIIAYRELVKRYPERKFCGQAFGAFGLEQVANCHERLEQYAEAIEALQELLERFSSAYYP